MGTQNPFRDSYTDAIFIGFAGRMGAGKTSAAMYLSSTYGFQYARYSVVLQEWLSPGAVDRGSLQEVGWDVMAGGRQAELNARLIARLDRTRSAAIDGLRHVIDFETLSSTLGAAFQLVFLEADRHRRFERLRSRFSSQTEFEKADSSPVESQADTLRPLASETIANQGSLADLHRDMDALLAGMAKGGRI